MHLFANIIHLGWLVLLHTKKGTPFLGPMFGKDFVQMVNLECLFFTLGVAGIKCLQNYYFFFFKKTLHIMYTLKYWCVFILLHKFYKI